ncbi:MAG: hypothetical protein LAP21_20010 [Acidobacteriia bacterium]|nr:hypothetical protein [Terriglobia bacterium]
MLLLMGMPAVACMLPGLEMTAAEKACCQEMAGRCGEMGMDPSHGCCTRLQHHDNQFVQNDQRLRTNMESPVLFIAFNFVPAAPPASPALALPAPEHSPPESPPHQFSILRI